MVDTPRFNPVLAKRLQELGGVKYIFLTHKVSNTMQGFMKCGSLVACVEPHCGVAPAAAARQLNHNLRCPVAHLWRTCARSRQLVRA
jgi:hypothetical protein